MSKYQVTLYEVKHHNKILLLVILGCFLTIVSLILVNFYLAKTITIKVDPPMNSSVTYKRGGVGNIYVYSFVERVLLKLYRWDDDASKDFKKNIEDLTNYLTPSCKKYLLDDEKIRFKSGELTSRTRSVSPVFFDDVNDFIIYQPPSRWTIKMQFHLKEYTSNGIEVKGGQYYWYVPIVRDLSNKSSNQYDLLVDCPFLNETPKKQSEVKR